jgi:hypothetical protein
MEEMTNKDLLLKNNSADTIVMIQVTDKDLEQEKHLTLLYDSSDNWKRYARAEDEFELFGYFGGLMRSLIDSDEDAHVFVIHVFQVVNGESVDVVKSKPFVRDGERWRCARIDENKNLHFLSEDEF